MDRTFTRDEAADYLNIGTRTVDREIERGRLEAFKIGRCVRIRQSACDRFLAAMPSKSSRGPVLPQRAVAAE
jgi:excisionase family DNA binding protein